MSAALIESYVERGYFPAGVCRQPQEEETPDPRDGECVVFCDFFIAGLHFPLDPKVPEILARFKVKIHQLTPNAFVMLSKFFWAVKSFRGLFLSILFVICMSSILRDGRLGSKMKMMLLVLRVGVARSCLEGRTDLRRLSVWSFPIARRIDGMMIGRSFGFMPRWPFLVLRIQPRFLILWPRR